MPSNIVNRLPQSLWQIIFRLVCTDGGRTGCTLALASKAFRRASTSARFYSV
ncbi:uncharacterized protein TRAVEDRAFT_112926, partial [Trametes versicolor FP-101664 SS1]|uniref:uncharacterized protein n=1 Tax=Trametes versicolor (strain FP-101664) TaxID=717944 RepID=UPI0004622E93